MAIMQLGTLCTARVYNDGKRENSAAHRLLSFRETERRALTLTQKTERYFTDTTQYYRFITIIGKQVDKQKPANSVVRL